MGREDGDRAGQGENWEKHRPKSSCRESEKVETATGIELKREKGERRREKGERRKEKDRKSVV